MKDTAAEIGIDLYFKRLNIFLIYFSQLAVKVNTI